jgi:hypothetical protein
MVNIAAPYHHFTSFFSSEKQAVGNWLIAIIKKIVSVSFTASVFI